MKFEKMEAQEDELLGALAASRDTSCSEFVPHEQAWPVDRKII